MRTHLLARCGAFAFALAFVPLRSIAAQAPCPTREPTIEVNRRLVRIEGATNLTDLLTRFISGRRLGIHALRPEDMPIVVVDGVPVIGGLQWLNAMPLNNVAAVTTFHPADATTRFGSVGSGGAIIIETRQGRTARGQGPRLECIARREP
jgi:hypothetical protein